MYGSLAVDSHDVTSGIRAEPKRMYNYVLLTQTGVTILERNKDVAFFEMR